MDPYLIDSHKLTFHPRRVADWVDARDDWERAKHLYPLYVEVSPAGACNHRCTFCSVDYIGYKTRYLDEAVLTDRLTEMGALGVKSVMFAGEGEPLLYRPLARVIRSARRTGLDLSITTNATMLTPTFSREALSDLAWVKCSINAGTAESYAKVHQTKAEHFDLALKNLAGAVKIREELASSVTLGAQMVLLPENAGDAIELAHRVREIGADYLVIKLYSQHLLSDTHVYDGIDYRPYYALRDRLDALATPRFHVVFRIRTMQKLETPPTYTQCQSTPFLWAYVMADGALYSCSAYLEDPRFLLGNLVEDSFQAVWEGERRRQNFEFVRQHLNITECRRNCRMDEANRHLWDLIHPPAHVNFI